MSVRLPLFLAVLAAATLCGCHEPQFTRERFETLSVGDEREDVRATLGRPTRSMDDQWFYDDLDHHRSALIHFDEHGRVTGLEWMDARTGAWEGRNPNADEPPPGQPREHRRKTTRIDDD